MNINVEVVSKLINEQFKEFSNLEIRPVEKSGHDNRTFHLGDDMSIRMPSGKAYSKQIEKEVKWLPLFKENISFNISTPISVGSKSQDYPYLWSINKWIDGETVTYENVDNLNEFARDLARFLKELQSIDASEGPIAGAHNFYRGGDLKVYDRETRVTLENLKDVFEKDKLEKIWNEAVSTEYKEEPLWIHGDVAVGNLLVKDGKLNAVIDFGILGTGDPACDYVMSWTFFNYESRLIFKEALKCDEDTWNRAKGWALWKALISYNKKEKTSEMSKWAKRTIEELLM